MKAIHVEDIRFCTFLAGAVEFHAGRRQMFYACPCGCGVIAAVDLMRVWAQRDPVEIREQKIGPDGKLCPGDLLEIGLINEDGSVHWSGVLEKGVWRQLVEEGV